MCLVLHCSQHGLHVLLPCCSFPAYLAKLLLAGLLLVALPQAHQHLVREAAVVTVLARIVPLGEAEVLVDVDVGSPQRAQPSVVARHGGPPLGHGLQLLDCNETTETQPFR